MAKYKKDDMDSFAGFFGGALQSEESRKEYSEKLSAVPQNVPANEDATDPEVNDETIEEPNLEEYGHNTDSEVESAAGYHEDSIQGATPEENALNSDNQDELADERKTGPSDSPDEGADTHMALVRSIEKKETRSKKTLLLLKPSLHDKAVEKCDELKISFNECVNQLLEVWLTLK